MIPDPGTDLRTIVTAAIVIPVVTFTTIGTARVFARLFRRWGRFTARAFRGVIVESIEAALAPRFDGIETRLTELAAENAEAHLEVSNRLKSIEERLDTLESRRRVDRPVPPEAG